MSRRILVRVVAREKARSLKRGGLVEVIEAKPDLGDIGGLDSLKRWLSQRRPAFGAAAREYHDSHSFVPSVE